MEKMQPQYCFILFRFFSYLQIESFGLRKSFPGPRPSAFAGVFDFFSRKKIAAKNASTNATLIFERAPGRTNRRQRNKATRHEEKTPTLKSNRVEWTPPPTSNRHPAIHLPSVRKSCATAKGKTPEKVDRLSDKQKAFTA